MTIHGSKLKLERPRYHKNQDNALINALRIFEKHNFWSGHWIFKIHTFLETASQYLSISAKNNPIRGSHHLKKCVGAINNPKHPTDQERKTFFLILLSTQLLYTAFSLPNTKKTPKNTSKLLDSSLFTKNTRYCSIPNIPFLGSTLWDLGFRGVDVAFWLPSTPLTF